MVPAMGIPRYYLQQLGPSLTAWISGKFEESGPWNDAGIGNTD
jgi:hypothetical protein